MDGRSYRPEIDGLRAVAVIPVVLFHAGFVGFSGGFVGVDIFFVISGYLIAGIILADLEAGKFTFARFYERRIRRIVPALLFVLGVTLGLLSLVALPDQLEQAGESAVAAMLSVSNVYFWRQSGYFAPVTEFMPFLHTWSLGVEEQFYLFLPVLIVVLVKARLPLRAALAVLLAIGFAGAVWLSGVKPSAAFYLLPARAWELGIGVALAVGLAPSLAGRGRRQVVSAGGLALIVLGVLWIDSSMIFPGWVALIPCLGAAMVIHSTDRDTAVYRVLASRPMVFIGLISYSLYLWHWPVFALLRLYTAHPHLPPQHAALGIAVSGICAWLTWRYVERPFRDRVAMPYATVLKVVGTTAAVIAAFSVAIVFRGGLPGRLGREAQAALSAANDIDPMRGACRFAPGQPACRFGPADEPVGFALVGDSHAAAVRPAVAAAAETLGGAGATWWSNTCPLLADAWLSGGSTGPECHDFKASVFEWLSVAPEIEAVVLAGRWEYQLTGILPETGGAYREFLVDGETETPSEDETVRVFRRALDRTLDRLEAMGKRVVIIGAIPAPGFDVPHTLALALHNRAGPEPTMSAESVASVHELIDRLFIEETAGRRDVRYVSVWRGLCDQSCELVSDGVPVFSDDDHLSASGATRVLGPILTEALEAVDSAPVRIGKPRG